MIALRFHALSTQAHILSTVESAKFEIVYIFRCALCLIGARTFSEANLWKYMTDLDKIYHSFWINICIFAFVYSEIVNIQLI